MIAEGQEEQKDLRKSYPGEPFNAHFNHLCRVICLSVENLSKEHPDQVLFKDLKFSLSKGDKVGLIANNGTGKSSLLKVLMGLDQADEGRVHLAEGLRIGYLEQDPEFNGQQTINELIEGSHTELLAVIRGYELALEAQTADYNDKTQRDFEKAAEEMERFGAWDYERRLYLLLDRFEVKDLDRKIESLSGGERKRLAMALTLLDDPELLIMDEPTNHLDIDMIEWLESHLSQPTLTVLMVTHDRYFLDGICNHILELQDGKLYHHKGNYAYFLAKRSEREEVFKTEIAKAGKLMKKELEWIRRSPKARGTKAKSRVSAFYETAEKASKKVVKDELRLEVKMARIGGKILEMKNVKKAYGEKVILQGFTHTFKKGERIGLVGRNGVGKSTFLNLLTGKEQADYGKINIGDTTVFGYYTQGGLTLKHDQRVIDVLKDIAEVIVMGDGRKLSASQFLEYFLFPVKKQRTFYSKLSGGEQRRLHLLTVLIKNPNFLILDEPTNDLDLLTLNKLEEFIEDFKGCLLMVSHDRFFMDKLVDQLFIFEGKGSVKGFIGSYRDYRELKSEEERLEKESASNVRAVEDDRTKVKREKKRLSFKEKHEYESLENEISELEREKAKLEDALQNAGTEFAKLQKISAEMGEVIDAIEVKTLRWMQLDELMESFGDEGR
ncbi:MAG: ABC-F family ATP-binding cassette domain-containing protein [Vicingaceae bacterium]